MIDYKALQSEYEFDVYPKRDIVLTKGKNARVWDSQGNEYVDCVAGHGVANIGHCNEAVIQAIEKQSRKLITCSGTFYNDTKAELLQKLISIGPKSLKKAFLCNSGTEAIEAAIKFARFSTGKTDFICAMRGFHGRTIGALSATFQPAYKKSFEPLVCGFNFVSFNKFEKLVKAVTDKTAAIILEIVQGEGGVHIGTQEYFLQVQQLCQEKGLLLIIDEVQTGFCRTGKMFACQHFDLQPDILCLAKGIAGGLPMGAVLCSDKLNAPIDQHGSTFGGNPLVCAASLAVIDFMVENRLDEAAKKKGEFLVQKLMEAELSKVREIRHLGLMIGIELKEKVKPYIIKLIESRVLTLPAGATVLRLLPPLTICYDELEIVADKIIAVLQT
ncbi:acetylornithine/succinylornithine family transaminase [candidate division KSB1 bacterium]|nr:acetylornithine/succinylornithine family transaminase [candidate division KSB1 bacterium]